MALRKRINPHSILNPDTGFGVDPSAYGGRFLNRDGTYNVVREGIPFLYRINIFQQMIRMPTWRFLLLIFLGYIGINLIFACIYWLAGVNQLMEVAPAMSHPRQFIEAFVFSAQTLTTVGYGHLSPIGLGAELISSFEALCGLMSFALITGLLYSRFARPRSFLVFSRNALIAPYKNKTGLMFRFVSYKERHDLNDVTVHVNLGLTVEENGSQAYKFYALTLERYHIDSLSMNWTVVHPIDEKSPLQNFTKEDLEHGQAELFVQITGFDEVFSATVVHKTSYFHNEIIYGAKFRPMYHENDDDTSTILELDKLHGYDEVRLP